MQTIIVEDEVLLRQRFRRLSEGIPSLSLVGEFDDALGALHFLKNHKAELLLTDIRLLGMDGVTFAKEVKQMYPKILIVFVSAYPEYLRDLNDLGGDYFILKPYTSAILMEMMEKMKLLKLRQRKNVYIQTFGEFTVFKGKQPVCLSKKSREILAYLVTMRGKEVSHTTLFSVIWEKDIVTHSNMKAYFNAIKRLRDVLEESELASLLISSKHGMMVNTSVFDCDYYEWLENAYHAQERFTEQFLPAYSWAEEYLAELIFPGE